MHRRFRVNGYNQVWMQVIYSHTGFTGDPERACDDRSSDLKGTVVVDVVFALFISRSATGKTVL